MDRKLHRSATSGAVASVLAVLLTLAACARAPYDLGRQALDRGDPAAALTHFDTAIAAGERVAESNREKGAAHLAAGRFEAAITALEPVRTLMPNDKRTLWLLGQSYGHANQPAEAAVAYRQYEELTTRRSVRRQVQLRVAQLKKEVARAAGSQLLAQRASGVEPSPQSIAVYAFAPQAGPDAPLQDQKVCRALEIWVSADLAKVSGVQAIAASQLEAIYAEQNFTYENRQLFAPASLVRTGNLQPARHMVRGVYGSFAGEQIALGAACFDARANESSTCANLTGEQGDLFEMETQLVLNLLGSLGVEPTAEERIAIGQKPTRNLDAFLAFADGVYLRDIGSFDDAASAFHEAAKIDPGFQMAKGLAASSEAALLDGVVLVAPPLGTRTASDRAQSSAGQLGLGLIPDADGGDSQSGNTNDVTTVRGTATLQIRGRAGGNSAMGAISVDASVFERLLRTTPVVVGLILAFTTSADGAILFGDDRELLSIKSHNSFRTWKVEDSETGDSRTIRQLTSRAGGTLELRENLDLVFYGLAGFSQDRATNTAELSGPGDFKLKTFLHVLQRRLLLAVGVNVPTGRTQLSDEQVRVGTAIAPHVLGFRMKNYGSGLDVDLGLATGRDLSPRVTVGGGINVLLRGAYDLDTASEYSPGHEIAATAGIDWRGDRTAATFDLVLRQFLTDQLDGADSFEEGNQLELNFVLRHHGVRFGVDAAFKDVIKSDSELLLASPPGAENRVSNGNNLWASIYPRFQGNEHWAVMALFDWVTANQSQQQDTSAWALGFGAGAELRITPVAILELRISRLTGGSEDDSLDLSGLDAVVSMRWQY